MYIYIYIIYIYIYIFGYYIWYYLVIPFFSTYVHRCFANVPQPSRPRIALASLAAAAVAEARLTHRHCEALATAAALLARQLLSGEGICAACRGALERWYCVEWRGWVKLIKTGKWLPTKKLLTIWDLRKFWGFKSKNVKNYPGKTWRMGGIFCWNWSFHVLPEEVLCERMVVKVDVA